jgi:hypothetical protein
MNSITAQIEGIEWIAFLIVLALLFLVAVWFAQRRRRHRQQSMAALPSSQPYYPAPPPPPQRVVQHTIERQVVKVRCRRCGTLNMETDRLCAACQAPL